MLRGSQTTLLSVAVALLIAGAAGRASAQEPTPLPFDPDLSIYVAHVGTWHNYATGEDEAAEIEDLVAAFEPGELVSEEPDIWQTHQINDPPLPDGWSFFEPVEDGTMQVHVIVRDAQNRLSEVTVADRDTGDDVGTLEANADGSEVAGLLGVSAAVEALDVTTRGVTDVLAKQTTLYPAVKKIAAFLYAYEFDANRGDDHPCPLNLGDGPWGDPTSVEGKVTVGEGPAFVVCGGPAEFENDSPNVEDVFRKYLILDKDIFKNTAAVPGGLPPDAAQAIGGKIAEARTGLEGGVGILEPYEAPPFSRGTVHWDVAFSPTVRAVVFVPYRARDVTESEWLWEISAAASDLNVLSSGHGTQHPSLTVAAELTRELKSRKVWVALPAVGAGSVWGATASTTGPTVQGLQGITTPVTFELWADLVPPAPGAPGLTGGTGNAVCGEAWTTPAPPAPMVGNAQLSFPSEGDDKGKCTVELAKGWEYTATGGGGFPFYSQGQVDPFRVPVDGSPRIETELQVLMTLKIKTVSQEGNEPSRVELEKQIEGGPWQPADSGNTVTTPPPPPAGGEEIWTRTMFLNPGTYRVRAQSRQGMMSPWSDWEEFPVAIGIEQHKTVTVVGGQMQMPPGGGGGGP